MEEKTSFEDNMKKLEQIATELEKGDLDLDTSVAKFEEWSFQKNVAKC